jgi:hypothetical protein
MRPALRYDRVVAVANPVALAIVVCAWKAGVAAGRMRPTAGFLVASTVLAIVREAAVLSRAARARAQSGLPLRWNVPLGEPLWIRISDAFVVFTLAAMIGAIVSLLGAPGVGAGVAATIALMGAVAQRSIEQWTPRSLMFAPDGLHVTLSRCRFVVAWNDVSGVDASGGDLAELSLLSVQRVTASVSPADDRVRTRVSYLLHDGSGVTGRLRLEGTLAGVDGATLARAVAEAAGRRSAVQPN